RRIVVRGNVISDNLNNPEEVSFQAGGILVTANSSDPQVESYDVVIEGNTVTNCQFGGIRAVSDVANPHVRLFIRRNTVNGSGTNGVITVDNVQFCEIADNTVVDDFTGATYGIYVIEALDFRILRNTVSGVGRQGIYVEAAVSTRFSIAGNAVDSVGIGLANCDGIKVNATVANNAECEIAANTVRNTAAVANLTKGINIDADLDYWTLRDNDVDVGGSLANAYVWTAPAHYTVSNNIGGEAGDL
ncbi:MAG: right-handed parallel beta-helix repeat-containing protein, partial [Gammaproteobacteria bacterium]|nr:right-handed parallel beta-helix repeat-containing protein [Gammaproteobacteria bacterium]